MFQFTIELAQHHHRLELQRDIAVAAQEDIALKNMAMSDSLECTLTMTMTIYYDNIDTN